MVFAGQEDRGGVSVSRRGIRAPWRRIWSRAESRRASPDHLQPFDRPPRRLNCLLRRFPSCRIPDADPSRWEAAHQKPRALFRLPSDGLFPGSRSRHRQVSRMSGARGRRNPDPAGYLAGRIASGRRSVSRRPPLRLSPGGLLGVRVPVDSFRVSPAPERAKPWLMRKLRPRVSFDSIYSVLHHTPFSRTVQRLE